jgi:LuxR family transcriptional regulator, maltose regulon positive regulatory protein
MQGRLHRAAEAYESLAGQNEASVLTGIADHFFGLGELNREWNHLDEAETILEQGVAQAQQYVSDGEATMRGYQSLARLKQARGDTRGAKATLDEFTQLARKYHLAGEVLAQADAVGAWLDLMAGNVGAAARWATAQGIHTRGELSYAREREHLTLARLLISRGRDGAENPPGQDVLQLLDRLEAAARAGGRIGSLIETLVLRSTAFQALGDRSNALQTIGEALALACPEGYMRVFLDEGEAMKSLIEAFVGRSLERTPVGQRHHGFTALMADADRLLAEFPRAPQQPAAYAAARASHDRLAEPLSDRELEVLRLIAAGASNASISETLHVALSTVKRHTGALYGKLGVNSRTQAVARSQQLGLIS